LRVPEARVMGDLPARRIAGKSPVSLSGHGQDRAGNGFPEAPEWPRLAAMSRTVTLVLVDAAGSVLGALPPFDIAVPWWPEVGEIVEAARERHGVSVIVLRLVATDRPAQPGGAVTYLAQHDGPPPDWLPLAPTAVDANDHPLRAPYARPGGPDASLRWACEQLHRLGHDGPVTAVQRKTWNLSAIWRLDRTDPGPAGTVWLKQLPGFLRHEKAVLTWLAATVPSAAPALLAADGEGRQLLAHLPGEDRFGAPVEDRYSMVDLLHTIQARGVDAVDDLIASGVPDLRAGKLADRVRAVAAAHGAAITGLGPLVDGLDGRFAAVRRCGLPDTLVHGDFHPGNVRNRPNGGSPPVILDWGDAFVGNPAFDALRMVDDLHPAQAKPLLDAWQEQWRASAPGSDPVTALELLRPVQALLQAVVYANFLANIEPSEHPYHAADVPERLNAAAGLASVETA
jgi:hypothetical protein